MGHFVWKCLRLHHFGGVGYTWRKEGIEQIWHETKLQGRGYINATSILKMRKKA